MSISTTTSRNNYTGNGTADTFAYSFRILDEGDLLVTVRDSVGTETTLVLTTDYTVTGVGESSGSIVLVDAAQDWVNGTGKLDTGWDMSIVRNVSLTQPTDIRNQGTFYPETHEDAFDRIVMQNQQQQDEINRGVRLPVTVDPSTFDPEIPAAVVGEAGAILQVNSTGDGWTVGASTVVGTTVTPFMETVLDDLNAAAARTTLGALEDGTGTVDATNLASDAVTTVKILDSNVTTAKIADANVTKAKLAEAVWAATNQYGGASAAGTDTYAVTPSPAYTAYATGMMVTFKADVANTAGATLNVNALGAKTLVDRTGTALETGAIVASQMVVAVYDGTNFQVLSPLSSPTQAIKAWVTFDGTGTPAIGASFNVSSITDHGTGDYTVNFTTAFANTNYAVVGCAGNNDATNQCVVSLWAVSGKAAGSCRIRVNNLTGAFDATQVHVAFIGAR